MTAVSRALVRLAEWRGMTLPQLVALAREHGIGGSGDALTESEAQSLIRVLNEQQQPQQQRPMAISLASIKRGTAIKAPKVAVYGVPGVGKTTFAADAPNPVFIQTEEGLGAIDVPHFPLAKSYQDVLDAMQALHQEDHGYQTVVVDSLDAMEPMLWEHVIPQHAQKDEKTIEDFGYGKGYVFAAAEWRTFLACLDALRNDRGMAVVVIAHSDIKRFESPDMEAFDRYQMRLHKIANELVCDWTDCLLFANYKVHVVKDETKFKKTRARGAGIGERIVHTEERPAFRAKNRYSLPAELPLSWGAFQDAVTESLTAARTPKEEPEPAEVGAE